MSMFEESAFTDWDRIGGRESFLNVFFHATKLRLDEMWGALLALEQDHPDPESARILFRAAHSIKGNAATFGFPEIADGAHAIEELLAPSFGGRCVPGRGVLQIARTALWAVEAAMLAARGGPGLSAETPGGGVERSPERRENGGSISAELIIDLFREAAVEMAAAMGKEIEVISNYESMILETEVAIIVVEVLQHLLRNSIAHGLETIVEREAVQKSRRGLIRLDLSIEGPFISVVLVDDGRGFDRLRILDKARALGVEVGDSIADSQLWQLLSIPGLTTATAVTSLSGRGVGLDIVRRLTQIMGGAIELDSKAGAGSKITVRVSRVLPTIT